MGDRAIAYFAVGAQAGSFGEWQMRAALSGGQGSSAAWVLLGELVANDRSAHAYRVGISYGSQGFDADRPDAVSQRQPVSVLISTNETSWG